jgi:hypothetical protein
MFLRYLLMMNINNDYESRTNMIIVKKSNRIGY